MTDNLPYRVEYSKTSRARCKACKSPIVKESLRLATVVQNPFKDEEKVKWYHGNCFFQKQQPKSTGDIAHFDNIRSEDQEFIKKQIEQPGSSTSPSLSESSIQIDAKDKIKNLKRVSAATVSTYTLHSDFRVEYARSNRSTCRGCAMPIIMREIRVSKKDFDTQLARSFGGIFRWYHLNCFINLRSELRFFEVGSSILGAETLSEEDRKQLEKKLPKIEDESVAKKSKLGSEDVEKEEKLKAQTDQMLAVRDKLAGLNIKVLERLLQENGQTVPAEQSEILDALADVMYFGALESCPKCNGQFEFKFESGYKCTGNELERVACENTTDDPKRKEFIIPEDLKEENQFLSLYKCEVKSRLLTKSTVSEPNEVKKDGSKINDKLGLFNNMIFILTGYPRPLRTNLKSKIRKMGGTIKSLIDENTTVLIASRCAVRCENQRVHDAKRYKVPIASENMIEEAKDFTGDPAELIKKHSIVSWVSN